jgi:hypothetical protein
MAKFYVKATYDYAGEVEADNDEQAYDIFLTQLDMYYDGLYSLDISEVEDVEESEDE